MQNHIHNYSYNAENVHRFLLSGTSNIFLLRACMEGRTCGRTIESLTVFKRGIFIK